MRADIFQKALLATARVACCASLLATCNKPEKVEQPTNNQASSQATQATMTLDECKALTVSVYTDKTTSATDQTKDCCAQIAQSIDGSADPMKATGEWAERGECCQSLDWQGSMACTPWGPPCPPAMGELS